MITIPKNRAGLVFKKGFGKTNRNMVSINNEIGYQADLLYEGTYLRYSRLTHDIKIIEPIKVAHDEIALVLAKDGKKIEGDISLGKVVECDDFQDAKAFIQCGGEKGRQLHILTEGTYYINPVLFKVFVKKNAQKDNLPIEFFKKIKIALNKVGIVNVLIGKENDYNAVNMVKKDIHNSYEKPQNFFDNGGYRGTQEEVITAGEYAINPWFAEIKEVDVTVIPTGTVGVIVSHTGKVPINKDNIIEGERGIWSRPLSVGKHPINTNTKTIRLIPTSEISLKWAFKQDKDTDNYDRDLEPIELGTKDGYMITLEVVQTIQIREDDAPKLISKIAENESMSDINQATRGNKKYPAIRNLINRKIQSQIESYFTSVGQNYNAIEFRDKKDDIQESAFFMIKDELNQYGVEATGLSIKIIKFPEVIDKQLRKKAEYMIDRINLSNDIELENMAISGRADNEKIKALGQAEIEKIELQTHKATKELEVDIAKMYKELEIAKELALIEAYGQENYLEMKRMENLAKVKFPEYSRMDMSKFLLTEFYSSRRGSISKNNDATVLKRIEKLLKESNSSKEKKQITNKEKAL